jgi:CheY-like chemotaxis protein
MDVGDALRKSGASVITAESVKACVKLIDEGQKFDLMILDINLEDGSGFSILDKIIKDRIPAKVIVCTSYVFIPEIGKSIGQFGVFSTLEKPFDPKYAVLEAYRAIHEGRYVCDEHNNSEVLKVENEAQRQIKALSLSIDKIISKILSDAKISRKRRLGFFRWIYFYEIDEESVNSIRNAEQLKENLERLLNSAECSEGNYSWLLMSQKILTPQIKSTLGKIRDSVISESIKGLLS